MLRLIRKLAIISLFADDRLINTFVLKDRNPIGIVYGITDRASIDIDVSMPNEFKPEEKISQKALSETRFLPTSACHLRFCKQEASLVLYEVPDNHCIRQ